MNSSSWSRTASQYMEFYRTSLEGWWNNMGPVDYVCILLGALVLGWLLLKGGAHY